MSDGTAWTDTSEPVCVFSTIALYVQVTRAVLGDAADAVGTSAARAATCASVAAPSSNSILLAATE